MPDAVVINTVRDLAWTVDADGPIAGIGRMTPEGLSGPRKMTPLVQRRLQGATPGSVDRAMKALGLTGIRRGKGVRTTIPSKDERRAGDLLNRVFNAAAPNRTWVTDFTGMRPRAGSVHVSSVVDVFAQKVVAWHAATSKDVELVMTPLRMATWRRRREGHPRRARRPHRSRPRGVCNTRPSDSPTTSTSRASGLDRSATATTTRSWSA